MNDRNSLAIADVKEILEDSITSLQAKYTWFDINGACAYAKCSRVTLMRAIKSGNLKNAPILTILVILCPELTI